MSTTNQAADALRITRGYPAGETPAAVLARALVGVDNVVLIDAELVRSGDLTHLSALRALLDGAPQRLTGAGAVNLTTGTTALTTTGSSQALTLADGYDGQI